MNDDKEINTHKVGERKQRKKESKVEKRIYILSKAHAKKITS
jgi:hypothetical protein